VQRRILREYVTPGVHSQAPGITIPPVVAHNFDLKPVLISMVQQSQFGGLPMEDANLHLFVFLEVCNTLKINGASTDAICLRLFSFSLRDKVRAWLQSLPPGSISTVGGAHEGLPCKILPTKQDSWSMQPDHILHSERR